jgi:hypothetical protein
MGVAAPAEHSHSTTLCTDHATHQPTLSTTQLSTEGRHKLRRDAQLEMERATMVSTSQQMKQQEVRRERLSLGLNHATLNKFNAPPNARINPPPDASDNLRCISKG